MPYSEHPKILYFSLFSFFFLFIIALLLFSMFSYHVLAKSILSIVVCTRRLKKNAHSFDACVVVCMLDDRAHERPPPRTRADNNASWWAEQHERASTQMNPEVIVKLQMRDGGKDCTVCFTGCVLLALECVCARSAPFCSDTIFKSQETATGPRMSII